MTDAAEQMQAPIQAEAITKKEIRKVLNRLAGGLLLYIVIQTLAYLAENAVHITMIETGNQSSAEKTAMIEGLAEKLSTSGLSYIIAVFTGIPFLWYFYRKPSLKAALFQSQKRMSGKLFLMIFFVFMSAQFLFNLLDIGTEALLNQFGYSIMNEIKRATRLSTNIPMFLYISFLGPISEEIIFRGFLLSALKKYGKLFAIVTSAILFGAYHGNLLQGTVAAVSGLVFGYVTIEYSIKWSILLHILNNLVFVDIIGRFISLFNNFTQTVFTYVLYGAFFIGGVIVFILKRKGIRNYLKKERTVRGCYRYAFTAAWMIIFLLLMTLTGINGIEKLAPA